VLADSSSARKMTEAKSWDVEGAVKKGNKGNTYALAMVRYVKKHGQEHQREMTRAVLDERKKLAEVIHKR